MPDTRFVSEYAADKRTSAQCDRDRILYAAHFARLAEITQVVSPERGYIFHNRLTHSLKVGQIARRLAEKCLRDHPGTAWGPSLPDPDAAEAAGLAHDLGHPPFGHVAEEELDEQVRNAGLEDGYEGNAQTFRIVVQLAASDARSEREVTPVQGLNLTRRTLNGILKYPWAYKENAEKPGKWGHYSTEKQVFDWVRQETGHQRRSLIAEIMDWADDITFAIHDLTDFYCAGRIPIDRCKGDKSLERDRLIESMFQRKPEWSGEREDYILALSAIVELFPFQPDERFTDSLADRARLYAYSSGLIRHFMDAFSVEFEDGETTIKVESSARREVEVLKQFIWQYVIENPDLAVTQNGQRLAVREVFAALRKAADSGRLHIFPGAYREVIRDTEDDKLRIRLVADCISGMTERELMDFHRRLSGLANGA